MNKLLIAICTREESASCYRYQQFNFRYGATNKSVAKKNCRSRVIQIFNQGLIITSKFKLITQFYSKNVQFMLKHVDFLGMPHFLPLPTTTIKIKYFRRVYRIYRDAFLVVDFEFYRIWVRFTCRIEP